MREVVRKNLEGITTAPCNGNVSGWPSTLVEELMQGVSAPRPEARLNMGCGRDIRRDWTNLDSAPPELLGVPLGTLYVQHDLDSPEELPFDGDRFDCVEASHLIEHLRDPLGVAERLHRVCRPGAQWVIRCPHGGSDDAWGDLTHRRAWFPESFLYFGQPTYWRADYGYRGDWKLHRVVLRVSQAFAPPGTKPSQVLLQAQRLRNVVLEMEAVLTCVKPIRPMERDQMDRVHHEIEVFGL